MYRLVRLALASVAGGRRRRATAARQRNGSVQGVNSMLLLLGVLLLLYFLARTQVSEPITWLVRRLQELLR